MNVNLNQLKIDHMKHKHHNKFMEQYNHSFLLILYQVSVDYVNTNTPKSIDSGVF